MKVAIPTDNGLTVAQEFDTALAYLILNLELGEIVHQEMRWNHRKESSVPGTPTFDMIRDCNVVIVREIGIVATDVLISQHKDIIKTDEPIITSAIMHYLGSAYIKESNTCCCP